MSRYHFPPDGLGVRQHLQRVLREDAPPRYTLALRVRTLAEWLLRYTDSESTGQAIGRQALATAFARINVTQAQYHQGVRERSGARFGRDVSQPSSQQTRRVTSLEEGRS